MGILFGLWRQIRQWDAPSKWALGMALLLLALAFGALAAGPPEVRDAALIGVVGLFIAVQVIVLWGNRGMVTPYTQAQRHYLAGEFEAARDVLQAHIAASQADKRQPSADVYTLLGNVYRQLGQLDQSQDMLTKALQLEPGHHFPLYGFGRTLLVQGQYAQAAETIAQALANGAPPVVQFDLGHAYYRQGATQQALDALQVASAVSKAEPHRALMARHLLHQLGQATAPTPDQVRAGLAFWQAEAERFAATPYGQAVQADVQAMQMQLQES